MDTGTKQGPQVEHGEDFLESQRNDSVFGSNAPPRTLKALDIISAGYNVSNSWAGVAATMYIGIISGGSATVIYGVLTVFVTVGCCAMSLAELAARHPTAGGQYHWSWLLAPKSIRRGASYATGVINVFSWMSISASVCVIIPSLVFGLVTFHYPNVLVQRWQLFLVYQITNLVVLAYNLFALRRAPWTHDIGFAFTLLCMLTFWIACLAKASPKAPSSVVWSSFTNGGTGWPDGVVFLTGIANPNFMYAGIDGAVHLAEDALNAATAVPWALISTLVIGFVTAFPFAVSMFYCINDPTAVIESPVPIFEIWRQATGSTTGATVMTALLIAIGFFSLNASQQTASRLTWSFARDKALVFSGHIGQIHPTLGVPVWGLFANAFVVFIIGCVYLGSSTAFNAIIGSAMILMHVSIAIPIVFLMLRGRDPSLLPEKNWNFGMLGWVFNAGTVGWAVIVTIFYCFPLSIPTTSGSMNYACVVLAVMAICGILNWFIYAKKHYEGPQVNLERLREASIVKY